MNTPLWIKRAFFRKNLRKFIKNYAVGFGQATSNAVLCVTRQEDWDEKNNDLWENPSLHSFARDLNCSFCGFPIVMSDNLFAQYEALEVKPKISCMRCAIPQMKKA